MEPFKACNLSFDRMWSPSCSLGYDRFLAVQDNSICKIHFRKLFASCNRSTLSIWNSLPLSWVLAGTIWNVSAGAQKKLEHQREYDFIWYMRHSQSKCYQRSDMENETFCVVYCHLPHGIQWMLCCYMCCVIYVTHITHCTLETRVTEI